MMPRTRWIVDRVLANPVVHAYLFTGPVHADPMAAAERLAQGLHCVASQRPCGECTPCQRIKNGTCVDHVVSHPTPHYKVDSIREIQADAAFGPLSSRLRTIVLNGFHHATDQAANALLKTLESPPNGVVFILTAPSPDHVLPTIRSRCVCLPCAPMPYDHIATLLSQHESVPPHWRKAGWVGIQALSSQDFPDIPLINDFLGWPLADRLAWANQMGQSKPDLGLIMDKWMVEVVAMIESDPSCLPSYEPIMIHLFHNRDRVRYNLNYRLCINSLLLGFPVLDPV